MGDYCILLKKKSGLADFNRSCFCREAVQALNLSRGGGEGVSRSYDRHYLQKLSTSALEPEGVVLPFSWASLWEGFATPTGWRHWSPWHNRGHDNNTTRHSRSHWVPAPSLTLFPFLYSLHCSNHFHSVPSGDQHFSLKKKKGGVWKRVCCLCLTCFT